MLDESKEKISQTQKKQYSLGIQIPTWLGKKHTKEYKLAMSNSIKNSIKWNLNHHRIPPQIGLYEREILDELQNLFGYKICRCFYVLDYWLDGYIPEINLAIEIDDSDHYDRNGYLKNKDIKRQEEIIKVLNCSFIRIKVKDYLKYKC